MNVKETSDIETIKAVRFFINDRTKEITDNVIKEVPVFVKLSEEEICMLMSTPSMLKELCIGYLFTEGIIQNITEVKHIEVTKEDDHYKINLEILPEKEKLVRKRASEAKSLKNRLFANDKMDLSYLETIGLLKRQIVYPHVKCDRRILFDVVSKLNSRAFLYRITGGTHAAIITDIYGKELAFAEDIGRYNAIDKAVGQLLLKGDKNRARIMAVSGRLSSKIVLKVARVGIPLLISNTAVTSYGVRICEKLGLTLVGFVREGRMNVYTHAWRIL